MIKKVILSLTLFSALSADEVDRIEKIVKDISELRKSYDICENELYILKQTQGDGAQKSKIYEKEIEAQNELFDRETGKLKAENSALRKELARLKSALTDSDEENLKIASLNQQIDDQKREITLLQKEAKIHSADDTAGLQDIIDEKDKEIIILTQAAKHKCKPCKVIDDNPFPTLIEKGAKPSKEVAKEADKKVSKKKEPVVSKKVVPFKKQTVIKEEKFAPSAFRLRIKSDIYDEYEGNVIEQWDEKTSFTSNIRKGDWIKITGYFVDGKWTSAGNKVLWIEAKSVIKR